jgi:hypothetical protein
MREKKLKCPECKKYSCIRQGNFQHKEVKTAMKCEYCLKYFVINEPFCVKNMFSGVNVTIENPATGEIEELDMSCHCGCDCNLKCNVH